MFLHLPGLSVRLPQSVCIHHPSRHIPNTSLLLDPLQIYINQYWSQNKGTGRTLYPCKGTGLIYNSFIPSVQFCIEWKRQVNFKIKGNTVENALDRFGFTKKMSFFFVSFLSTDFLLIMCPLLNTTLLLQVTATKNPSSTLRNAILYSEL